MKFITNTKGMEKELRSLWERCFPTDGKAYVDYLFNRKYEPANCFALTVSGELACALHLLPLEIVVRGKRLALPFIYGAATFPEFRKTGKMRELLRRTYEELQKRGMSCVALYPFNYGFYRKAGFGVMEDCAACEYPVELFDGLKSGEAAFAPSPERMKEAFDSMMSRFDTRPVRGEARCKDRLLEWQSDGGSAVMCDGGYALYAPLDGVIETEEFVYTDASSMKALLAALASVGKATGSDTVKLVLPIDELPHQLFGDDRACAYAEPHAMLCIFDLPNFFDGMKVEHDVDFVVNVTDSMAKDALGAYGFTSRSGVLSAKKADEALAEATVFALAELACGRIDVRTATALGLLRGESKTLGAMAKVFAKQKGFFFEKY